jgi:hypothetical protein
MGRRRTGGNYTPQKKKKIQWKIWWEMKKMNTQFLTTQNNDINVTYEHSDIYPKKSLKKKIMEEITEKLMEKILDTVNQKVQDTLKKL